MAQETGVVPAPNFSAAFYTEKQPATAGLMVPKENWGSISVRDLQAGLIAEKASYLTGQPVRVAICLSNTSTRVLNFIHPDDPWPCEYDFIITRNNGQKVSLTTAAEMYVKRIFEEGNFGGFRGFSMRPGDIYLVQDYISAHYDMSVPGEYEIIAEYPVPNWKWPDKIPLRSGVIHVQIVTQEMP